MKKIFGPAKILRVEMPDALRDTNEEKGRADVRLVIRYSDDAENADKHDFSDLKGIDTELLSLAEKETSRNDYTYLWDCTRTEDEDFDAADADLDDLLEKYKKKLTGKILPFTTYEVTISELLQDTEFDGESAVHSDDRAYTKLSNTYLLSYEDSDAVFAAIQSRLLENLEDDTWRIGRADQKTKKKTRKEADEEENEDKPKKRKR
jgi:hypothetical protein